MSTTTLFRNIQLLAGIQPAGTLRLPGQSMKNLPDIEEAFLYIEDGIIRDYGLDADCPYHRADRVIDAQNRIVLPAYCDSHTHIVFAAWREQEFVDRIHGLTYKEIAERGGGILNSAAMLQRASEDELFDAAHQRLMDVVAMGTGAIEIKSGYGLTTESEVKMLRVIRRLKELNLISVKATFLGAHAIPAAYKSNRSGYVELLIREMLPKIAGEGLADYVDVFCDKGFYTVEETDQILSAAAKYGLKPKIHANELDYSGGIQVGVKHQAISVDHLEYAGPEELDCLASGQTIATILPSTAFFLGLPYSPARQMMERDICVALASDFNPGSSPSGNMSFILSLACIKLKMLPEEAFNALTINGAAAMEVSDATGSITPGKEANILLSRPGVNLNYLPYAFGQSWIDKVFIRGRAF